MASFSPVRVPQANPARNSAKAMNGMKIFSRGLYGLDDRRLPPDKIGVPVGIQQESHFHNSGSIRR